MKEEIKLAALNAINEHRRTALKNYEEANSKVFNDEEYKELERKYQKAMIENARLSAYGEKPDRTKELSLKEQLEQRKVQKSPNFACDKCKDEGYIDGQMCSCLKKEISKVLLKDSGFEKLENFEEGLKNCGNLKDAYSLMQRWCNSDFKKITIYLAGPTGVGKTYLIRCMANELIARGKLIKIVTAYKLNQDFREFSKSRNDEILQNYIDCEVLFIDDLGTEPFYKNITLENLYIVLNERKTRKLPTVITSNLTLSDIMERYDERISSRLADRESAITLFLDGEDRRLKR